MTRSGGGLTAVAVVALAVLATAPASSAAPTNDGFGDRIALQLGFADTRSNADATIEPGERLTPNDPGGLGCDKAGTAAVGGIQMDATMWWEFTGNGGPITVSSQSSTFDTVLAVYEVAGDTLVGCNDDIQPVDPTRPNLQYRLASELLFDSVAGASYAVQVGACTPVEKCGSDTGSVTLRVSPTPPNDNRAAATPIGAGAPLVATNTGSTLEPGETTMCGLSPYAKTIWFRYTAPAIGAAAFSAAGFDTVLAIYRDGSTTPLGCNDDAVAGQAGASRLPTSQPAGPPVEVAPGDYLIQVGGYYDPGFSTIAARNGPLEVQVEFTADTDIDNDGVNRDRDCDDDNANIRPGLPEIRGNHTDEDCDGKAAPLRRLRPAIEMRSTRFHGGDPHTWVRELFVGPVPKGARIEIRCRGGCSLPDGKPRTVRQFRAKLVVAAGFRLEVGARLDVIVTKAGWIGRGKAFRILSDKPRKEREYCVGPHGNRRTC